jgi:hypothetical protein
MGPEAIPSSMIKKTASAVSLNGPTMFATLREFKSATENQGFAIYDFCGAASE